MTKWFRARKKPVEVLVREVEKDEFVDTKNGRVLAIADRDYIIEGVDGEHYPIDKQIFFKTYEVVGEVKSVVPLPEASDYEGEEQK